MHGVPHTLLWKKYRLFVQVALVWTALTLATAQFSVKLKNSGRTKQDVLSLKFAQINLGAWRLFMVSRCLRCFLPSW